MDASIIRAEGTGRNRELTLSCVMWPPCRTAASMSLLRIALACHRFFFSGHQCSLPGGPVFGVHYRPKVCGADSLTNR